MKRPKPIAQLILTIATVAGSSLTAGCDDNKKLAEMATESAQRQAEQNQEMARVNREVAAGSKRLVEANSEANRRLLATQQNLDDQRTEIDEERKSLASERNREPILAAVITEAGALLICSLPLVLCWYLLHGIRRGGQEADISELLIEEMVATQPAILSDHPRAIDQHDLAALENQPHTTG
jgi:outer membrane murein-binding lipoprotein Lpp